MKTGAKHFLGKSQQLSNSFLITSVKLQRQGEHMNDGDGGDNDDDDANDDAAAAADDDGW